MTHQPQRLERLARLQATDIRQGAQARPQRKRALDLRPQPVPPVRFELTLAGV